MVCDRNEMWRAVMFRIVTPNLCFKSGTTAIKRALGRRLHGLVRNLNLVEQ